MKKKKLLLSLLLAVCAGTVSAQTLMLTLDRTIAMAADSSLEAFRSKNMYLAGYWQFRTYRAARLPSLTLNLTPAQYYRDITRRYDSSEDIDVYRRQQSYYASGGLEVTQNFDLLGGSFFLNSDLGYMRNFGANTYSQFTTIPLRIGYMQNLMGYNPFKWERKIEPVKYEKTRKELLYNLEHVSEEATGYFFDLAMAQTEYEMAREDVASSDTLYRVSEQRHKIASITQSDLLTLKLDAVNARNKFQNAEIDLKRAMFRLVSYLNFDKNTEVRLVLPGRPASMTVVAEEALMHARENNPQFLGLHQQILEAEQKVDQTRKEAMFNASLMASIGFNQVADNFRNAFRDPMQQNVVSFTISVPLIDWGVRRGKYNIAKNELNVTQISARQNELTIEEDLIMTVGDFNIRQQLIASTEEALDLAQMAYAETKQRFLIGKADISSLTLSLQRQQNAQRNYIDALRNYWLSYYKIRKLTLYDFVMHAPLADRFDYLNGF
ncbi:MAG: TolC family protein [Tannerella sp.]|jgi:outer membrane protein TolC|nr:TolC family protein [Tannerella sp.]